MTKLGMTHMQTSVKMAAATYNLQIWTQTQMRGWAPVKPVQAPQYFYTDRSKAVLLLWFLTVLTVCIYTLVQLLC